MVDRISISSFPAPCFTETWTSLRQLLGNKSGYKAENYGACYYAVVVRHRSGGLAELGPF